MTLLPAARLAVGLIAGVLAALPAVAAAADPSGPSILDGSRLAGQIARELRTGLGSGAVRVTCDADVPVAKGAMSRCQATVEGQRLGYTVRQATADGAVTYRQTKAIVDLDRAQSLVARWIARQMGGKWKVSCTPAGTSRLYVIGVGKTFTCPISGKDGGGTNRVGTIGYRVKNLSGSVTWESL